MNIKTPFEHVPTDDDLMTEVSQRHLNDRKITEVQIQFRVRRGVYDGEADVVLWRNAE